MAVEIVDLPSYKMVIFHIFFHIFYHVVGKLHFFVAPTGCPFLAQQQLRNHIDAVLTAATCRQGEQ